MASKITIPSHLILMTKQYSGDKLKVIHTVWTVRQFPAFRRIWECYNNKKYSIQINSNKVQVFFPFFFVQKCIPPVTV